LPKKIKFCIYEPLIYKNINFKHILNVLLKKCVSLKTEIKNIIYGYEILLTSSGRDALYIALKSLNLEKEDCVLCLSFNCTAVVDAIYSAGLVPKFVDINDSFQMDISSFEKAIDRKTKAVILTHTYGVDELSEIIDIAYKYKLSVINDVAQYLFLNNGKLGGGLRGDFCVYSFSNTKPISSYKGGIVVRLSSEHVFPNQYKSLKVEKSFDFISHMLIYNIYHFLFKTKIRRYFGMKLKLIPNLKQSVIERLPSKKEIINPTAMSPINMKLLLYLLYKKNKIITTNSSNYKYIYNCLIRYSDFVKLLDPYKGNYNYATLIFKDDNTRWMVSKHLSKNGIQTTWNYYPLHKIKIYDDGSSLEKTECIWKKVLSIPFKYPNTQKSIEKICSIIVNIFDDIENRIYNENI